MSLVVSSLFKFTFTPMTAWGRETADKIITVTLLTPQSTVWEWNRSMYFTLLSSPHCAFIQLSDLVMLHTNESMYDNMYRTCAFCCSASFRGGMLVEACGSNICSLLAKKNQHLEPSRLIFQRLATRHLRFSSPTSCLLLNPTSPPTCFIYLWTLCSLSLSSS